MSDQTTGAHHGGSTPSPTAKKNDLLIARDHCNQFLGDRLAAAEMSTVITVLESARTALRHRIIERLMGGTPALSKTAATDQARTSPEYIEASKEIMEAAKKWEILFASAEHQRMLVNIITLEVTRGYERENAKAELMRLDEMIQQRIRTLNEEG